MGYCMLTRCVVSQPHSIAWAELSHGVHKGKFMPVVIWPDFHMPHFTNLVNKRMWHLSCKETEVFNDVFKQALNFKLDEQMKLQKRAGDKTLSKFCCQHLKSLILDCWDRLLPENRHLIEGGSRIQPYPFYNSSNKPKLRGIMGTKALTLVLHNAMDLLCILKELVQRDNIGL